jgi:cullin 3
MNIPSHVKRRLEELSGDTIHAHIQTIESTIDDIYNEKSSVMNFKNIYDIVYTLVTKQKGMLLYQHVKSSIERHTRGISAKINESTDEVFLPRLLAIWEKYRKSASMIRDLLMFLDERFVEVQNATDRKLLTVFEQGIFVFRNEVLIKLTERVQRLMLSIIKLERDGILVADKFLLRNLTQMMVEIDKERVYIPVFERMFLIESHIYYQREAQEIFEASTAVVYLQKVQERLKEETERAERCLDPDTKPKIEAVVKEEMIEKYKELVVKKEGSGVLVMLQNKSEAQLRLVFDVLSLVDHALQPTIEIYKEYVIKQGLAIVTDDKMDKDYMSLVNAVIDLRVYYDKLLLNSFSKVTKGNKIRDIEFSKATKEAFDKIVNENSRFPEYLSLLLDKKLKKGKKQVEEDQLDTFFDNVILVFRHVKEKDVFEKYYKEHLSQRLLEERSASDDAEKSFLTKLKAEFGYQFTSKLEGMFKDMKISKELMTEWKMYRDNLKEEERAPIDLSVQVLTHGYWPVTSTARCDMPEQDLIKSAEVFAKFYLAKHNGRKLTWQYNMGTADVVANGYSQPYTFTVSTYQMAILLLFNENEQISLGDIHEATKIPIFDLKKHIVQMCKAADEDSKKSSKLLLPKSDDKDQQNNSTDEKKKAVVTSSTIFTPNPTFKSKKIKMNLNPPVGVEDAAKKKNTETQIEEERKWVVDAVIVRIMKARKTLMHGELILEVTKQLQNRFMPSPSLVKKRIENLIEREYLERADDNRGVYRYLA